MAYPFRLLSGIWEPDIPAAFNYLFTSHRFALISQDLSKMTRGREIYFITTYSHTTIKQFNILICLLFVDRMKPFLLSFLQEEGEGFLHLVPDLPFQNCLRHQLL